jgi:hypothetical protein
MMPDSNFCGYGGLPFDSRDARKPKWESMPISPKCEVMKGRKFCGRPTTHAYPAEGGGYMALCRCHARKHTEAWPIQEIDEKLSK